MTLDIVSTRALADLGAALRARDYRFITVTPATHRRVNRRPENAWARDLRGVLGWSRPFRAGVLPPDIEALLDQAGLLAACADGGRRALVRASTIGKQLYFHSAWPTRDEDAVFFGPDTYRYVALLDRALALPLAGAPGKPIHRAVDIGCGAGPGAIELALRCPGATVYGADINADALALAAVNASINGAAGFVARPSDLLDGIDGNVDFIMANPPFILDPAQLTYRNGGGEHGAQLSIDIVRTALARLEPGGTLLLYTGVAIVDGEDGFLAAIRPLLEAACSGWRYEEIDPDIFGGQLACEGYEEVERIAAVGLQAVKREQH